MKKTRVFVCADWSDKPETVCEVLNKQSKGNNIWDNIEIVSTLPADYYVIINAARPDIWNPFSNSNKIDLSRSILFRMEPYMENKPIWGCWSNPNRDQFLFAGFLDKYYNNIEFHISKTYTQLMDEKIDKSIVDTLSSIISNKYIDGGHKKRVDFLKYVEHRNGIKLDIYGTTDIYWKNYKGALPPRCKDDGLIPYKYTFNGENHRLHNYVTEKLYDGIVCECLTFYYGAPNVSDIIDERAYVVLELEDFEKDYNTIKKMIEEDEWSKRIDIIRAEKKRILNDLQFFPRVKKIIDVSK